jgi:hypothetical protein
MRTIPEFVTLKFRDEETWRTAVSTFIRENPHAHVNSTGDFDLVIPQPLEHWAEEHLPRRYDILREGDEAKQEASEPTMGRDRGRGASPDFDKQEWLDKEADALEKDNERLRNKIFR